MASSMGGGAEEFHHHQHHHQQPPPLPPTPTGGEQGLKPPPPLPPPRGSTRTRPHRHRSGNTGGSSGGGGNRVNHHNHNKRPRLHNRPPFQYQQQQQGALQPLLPEPPLEPPGQHDPNIQQQPPLGKRPKRFRRHHKKSGGRKTTLRRNTQAAPNNNNEFLMEEHDHLHFGVLGDGGGGGVGPGGPGGSGGDETPDSSPEDEAAELFLARDFSAAYDVVHAERLQTMNKSELMTEYLLLEERVETLERQLRRGRVLGRGGSTNTGQLVDEEVEEEGPPRRLNIEDELEFLREENQKLRSDNKYWKRLARAAHHHHLDHGSSGDASMSRVNVNGFGSEHDESSGSCHSVTMSSGASSPCPSHPRSPFCEGNLIGVGGGMAAQEDGGHPLKSPQRVEEVDGVRLDAGVSNFCSSSDKYPRDLSMSTGDREQVCSSIQGGGDDEEEGHMMDHGLTSSRGGGGGGELDDEDDDGGEDAGVSSTSN